VIACAALTLAGSCRAVERADSRIVRADALTRAEAWPDAASLWGEIYRDSGGEDRRAGLEAVRALGSGGWSGVARSRLMEMERHWPEDAEIQELLGRAHEGHQDQEAARQAYMRALQLEPGRPYSLARVGVLSADLEVPAAPGEVAVPGSLARLRAAGVLDQVDAASLRELGLRAASQQRFDEAFDALQAALSSGELSTAQKVEAAAALAPDPRTIPWLLATVRADPLHTRALTLLGNAQLAAGYLSRAVATLEQAASSDPSDEAALRAFADALSQTGQPGRAREILDLLKEG
jgi:tetratricopeptide (TPR) repeat protein